MDETIQAPDGQFRLRLWGVRGSIPTPVERNLGHGGNTACVQICMHGDDSHRDDELLIIDAGSGIRALGAAIAGRAHPPSAVHIFLTHFHWDHVQGLPFFAPLFAPHSRILFHSVHPPQELRAVLARQMATPFFPLDFGAVAARTEFRQIVSPQTFGAVTLETFSLHHPQGSVGYRISDDRRAVVYATDHEHGVAPVDLGLRAVASHADALIYDAQYTAQEYASRKGWGHSTWQEAVAVARDAQVGKLVLFHHDPDRDDQALDAIVAQAQKDFPHTVAARESMSI
jgi:phosphoribosyl 1,2-cyclic phosphodiesterase